MYHFPRDYYDGFSRSLPRDFYGNSDFWAGLGFLLVILGIFVMLWAAFRLVMYILRSIGLYRIAVNRGMSSPGLAWIPVVGQYRIGSVADSISEQNGSASYFRHILLVGLIVSNTVSGVFNSYFLSAMFDSMYDFFNGYTYQFGNFAVYSGLSQVFGLLGLATYVITIIALNKIYQYYRPYSATSWTVLSVIFPFMQSIFLFILRNDMMARQYHGGHVHYPPLPQGSHGPAPGQAPGYPPPPQYPPRPGGYYPPAAPQPPAYDANPQYPPQPPYPQQAPYQPPQAPNSPEPPETPKPAEPPNTGEPSETPKPAEASDQAGVLPTDPPPSWGVNDNPQNGR